MACATLIFSGTVLAQEFPSKPLRIVIHVSPGSGTDHITRAVGAAMGKSLGQPAIIENRPGAGGLIAYEYVARQAPADGHTLVTGGSSHAPTAIFVKDLRVDPKKELVPVSMFGEGVQVLAAAGSAPFTNFKELIAYARSNPGKVTFGSSGFASTATLNTFSLQQRYGLEVTDVPYGGNSPARLALMAGTIDLMWYTEGEFVVDAAEKRIRGILVSAAQRLATLPDVPSGAEVGHPLVGFYYGLSVAAATPRPFIDKLAGAMAFALRQPEVIELGARYFIRLAYMDPDASKAKLAELAATYTDIAIKAGIKPR